MGQDGDPLGVQRQAEAVVAAGEHRAVRSDLQQRRRPARLRTDLRGRSEGQGLVSGRLGRSSHGCREDRRRYRQMGRRGRRVLRTVALRHAGLARRLHQGGGLRSLDRQ